MKKCYHLSYSLVLTTALGTLPKIVEIRLEFPQTSQTFCTSGIVWKKPIGNHESFLSY